MQAFEKAAEAGGDEARQEIIQMFGRMAAQCEEWLAVHGEPEGKKPAPGISEIHFADYTRRVKVQTNVPANLEDLEDLNELYVAEGNLLNKTQRALMEHHLRFNQNPDDPTYTPVADVIRNMQAFAAKMQGFVLTAPRLLQVC